MNESGLVSKVQLKCDGTSAETRFRLSAQQASPFKSGGLLFSCLLAAKVCVPVVSDFITCRKYTDHSLKSLLQGRKKWVKRRGEDEIVYNVHKFMKTECEVSQSLLQKCIQGLLNQHALAEELYAGY